MPRALEVVHRRILSEVAGSGGVDAGVLLDLVAEARHFATRLEYGAPERMKRLVEGIVELKTFRIELLELAPQPIDRTAMEHPFGLPRSLFPANCRVGELALDAFEARLLLPKLVLDGLLSEADAIKAQDTLQRNYPAIQNP